MSTRSERAENAVQVLVLLAVGGMAGAASFTHMHDWTMTNSSEGTPEWFGWGNAVISELTPLVAGLEVRRQRRAGNPAGLALTVLVVFASLSMAAQFAQAKPGLSGWLLAGLPAAAFMILIKLVLSRAPIGAEVWPEASAVTSAKLDPKPAPAMRKPEAEAPQVSGLLPLPVLPAAERKFRPEVTATIKPKPAGLLPARRTPETTWKAAQDVMATDPSLSFKAVAERVGVSDRRLRQIRSELAEAGA